MTESQEIKKAFTRLRDFGNIVFNFNSNKPNNAGIKGMPDWLILTKKHNIIFIEVKIGKDFLSSEQEKIIKRLAVISGLPGSRVEVFIVHNAKEANLISDNILRRDL